MTPHFSDATSEETARYYAARAPEYDLSAGYLTHDRETLRVAKKKRYQKLFRGHDVLEIACGTGYWTEVLAETAKSVVGIDVNPEMIDRAQSRCGHLPHVKFRLADAYNIGPEAGTYTAGFAVWWWSHIPRARVGEFLQSIHRRLIPGALVVFSDQLEYVVPRVDGMATQRHEDSNGDTIERRILSDGREYDIVKNFPTEQELVSALCGFGSDIQYREWPEELHWELTYNAVPMAQPE
ncbi:MAG: methyltransferase domain-containing protein [Gemmatimonadota bacterium]|nr:methyltransferase domain-containing protein [Gemmatimonadota bacterium]